MEGDIIHDDKRPLSVEHNGKLLRVEYTTMEIFSDVVYMSIDKHGSAKVSITPINEGENRMELNRGDMLFIMATHTETGKAAYLYIPLRASERDKMRQLFLVIYHNSFNLVPVKILGTVMDLKDQGIPVISIPMGAQVKGECSACSKGAMDACTICERPLCPDHVLIGLLGIPMTAGYCEGCAYALGLIDGVPEPTEKHIAYAKSLAKQRRI